MSEARMVEVPADQIEHVDALFERLKAATNLIDQAYALVALNDAMSDLRTWHPDWDFERGEIRVRAEQEGEG